MTRSTPSRFAIAAASPALVVRAGFASGSVDGPRTFGGDAATSPPDASARHAGSRSGAPVTGLGHCVPGETGLAGHPVLSQF